ncbi:endonuclease domain-containing protein [Modestobacter lapidis]|nr:hypothetical protein [Modestobacter lapidis]
MDFGFYRTVAAQGGVFTVAQALDCCSDAEVRRLVREGRWRRSRWRGVLVDGELPDSPAATVRAAALVVGPDLVACHTTAATLWGFALHANDDVHFLGPASLANRRRSGIQVHPSFLGTDDAVLVDGVWCTPPARTACDVVRLGRPVDGLATLDLALATDRCTPLELAAAAAAQAGLRSVVRLRGLLPYADGRSESPMESRMRWRYLDGGLPAPDLQVELRNGRTRRRLDVGWREPRVGAEYDGLESHMTREQLRDDRERANWVREQGWSLVHVTDLDVYRRPRAMVLTAARAIGMAPPADRPWLPC